LFCFFVGEIEQKRRAQSFLAGQEPKAGKLVRGKDSPNCFIASSVKLALHNIQQFNNKVYSDILFA